MRTDVKNTGNGNIANLPTLGGVATTKETEHLWFDLDKALVLVLAAHERW
jgi:hypothetical protein